MITASITKDEVVAHSAMGFGQVRHSRTHPKPHAFRYSAFMPLLDLSALSTLFSNSMFWSLERSNLAAFHREDYLGDPAVSLSDTVWQHVEAELGPQPRGRVLQLANLRYWGYCINPIAQYFCFDQRDRAIALLADVTNTPWGENRQYVVPLDNGEVRGYESDKILHVSPFMKMNQQYRWNVRLTDQEVFTHIVSKETGTRMFDASMRLALRPLNRQSLASALAHHPFMTGKVVAGIYWQALRLRLKGMEYVPPPANTQQLNKDFQ